MSDLCQGYDKQLICCVKIRIDDIQLVYSTRGIKRDKKVSDSIVYVVRKSDIPG